MSDHDAVCEAMEGEIARLEAKLSQAEETIRKLRDELRAWQEKAANALTAVSACALAIDEYKQTLVPCCPNCSTDNIEIRHVDDCPMER